MKKKQAVRQAFRDVCLKRDNYKCRVCGFQGFDEELDVHHILDRRFLPDELKYVQDNGITLCFSCHREAEEFHISEGKIWAENYHPNDLYSLIKSPWRTKMWESIRTSYYEEA